jgi:hypothetical protein
MPSVYFRSHHAGGKKLQEWEKNTLAEKDATIRILYQILVDKQVSAMSNKGFRVITGFQE